MGKYETNPDIVMTSREVVTRAIEFRQPAWLPVKDYGPEQSDVIEITCEEIKPNQAQNDPQLDQWLCRWEKADYNLSADMGQVVEHPLKDLAAMANYPWPDGADPRRTAKLPKKFEEITADPLLHNKYVRIPLMHLLWERMCYLRGFEECLIGVIGDLPEMHEIADRIIEYLISLVQNIHNICGSQVQGIGFGDDWGTQTSLQISPQLWRRFFKPRYSKFFKVIHNCGWHIWFHSCGRINSILPDMVELGVDVVNLKQPLTNGIEEIGREFAGKICFETVVDVQKTLPKGDRHEIVAEAKALLKHWSTPDGGFILCDVSDHRCIGSRPENKQFVLDTFRKLDPYRKQIRV